jgi:adenosylcobinamide kinase / adenosylcobinamide-phosphate guanylyltransferase
MSAKLSLILGGARSGKSRIAEQRSLELHQDSGLELVYLATGTAGDAEMQARIDRHVADRESQNVNWVLVEEPLELGRVIAEQNNENRCILVDCLTLWLSNCLPHNCWPEQKKEFISALKQAEGDVILVSNETGLGVVPMGELSRTFVDESGFLHQELAQICDRVTLVVAGLTTELKE